eukprot:CAMPEP_0113301386 /NCGR_PEP_ID=MMETSP0010_2-20120614/2639_1 /TAXON_ID=216773 ORGANISM="Corethron hystrix, Strain 308" /NCGR_SAMPLE_ID=MMETSP0010_2 /ASSEMBLY_ACC=CAM_ASM_000155 /LENGTH=374 /DNA_ID=CAMNT_0000155005 /DNA_START=78 /DNA_END=1202 /DNA_ORIENTATION=+ /assembly_acc=CAM_ASM_000155
MGKTKFYAVASGRNVGEMGTVVSSWSECQNLTKGFKNAKFKSFVTFQEAEKYLKEVRQKNSTAATEHTTRTSKASTKGRGKFYAIAVGKNIDSSDGDDGTIVRSWEECQQLIRGVKRALYKSFLTLEEAENFIALHRRSSVSATSSSDDRKRRAGKHEPTVSLALHFDGGSRGNPGLGGSGARLSVEIVPAPSPSDTDEPTVVFRSAVLLHRYFPRCTNNVAEYSGLVIGLEEVERGLTRHRAETDYSNDTMFWRNVVLEKYIDDVPYITLRICGDSELIINQMRGLRECRHPSLVRYHNEAKDILGRLRNTHHVNYTLEHVYRDHNKEADALANKAMDERANGREELVIEDKMADHLASSKGCSKQKRLRADV